MKSDRGFPLAEGATCGFCGGKVDAFGCANECAESRECRVPTPHLQNASASERLDHIKRIAEIELKQVRPEFAPPALIAIHEVCSLPATNKPQDEEER